MGAAQPLTVIRERYRLDALIGEGGMASVWRAWDLTLQRPVAVKLLFARESHTEEVLVDRFLREARIAASVQHRNVIHIVDFGTTLEGQPFMVMELLEGETLAARLRRQKPLPVADVVQIGHLTLRGLGAVHAAGIIHRDLKPENVYLKNEGGVVYPKILDFGISRSIDPPHGPRSALTTREGVIVGTPEYMSPEQARGVKQLDYRTDIYSMGVVLYESLCGRLPFVSENVGDLIIKIVTGSAPPVHELVPTVPRAVSDVVARAMARLPGDRFLDAAEMQEALIAASHAALPTALPALSNLPPEVGPNKPLSVPRALGRPLRTLPRTQAMRVLPNPLPPPPPPANVQTLPPSAAMSTLPPHTPPSFGIIEAVPRQAFDPGYELALDDAAEAAAGPAFSAPVLASAETPATAQPTSAAPPEPPEATGSPLSTRPTDPAPAPSLTRRPWLPPRLAAWLAWLAERDKRLYLGAGASLLALSLLLWATQSGDTRPPPVAPTVKTTRVAAHKPPVVVVRPTVALKLRGVPDGAQITLDGAPSTEVIELARGEAEHEIAVEAPGKQRWHMLFVPRADSVIDVSMLDALPAPAEPDPPAPANRPKHGTAKWRSKIRALRVPDF